RSVFCTEKQQRARRFSPCSVFWKQLGRSTRYSISTLTSHSQSIGWNGSPEVENWRRESSSFVQKISMNRGASWRTLRTCSQRLQYCWLSILLLDYTGEDRSNPKDIESTTSSIGVFRSEEHTSELQSRFDLVCRLLLEKKKY